MDVQTTTTRYSGLRVGNPPIVVEGMVSSAKILDKVFDGEPIKEFVIELSDRGEVLEVIDFRGNNAGFALIASLASCNLKMPVKICVKHHTLSDGDVVRLDVYQDGNRVPWSEVDDVPRYGRERDLFLSDVFKTRVIDRLSLGHG